MADAMLDRNAMLAFQVHDSDRLPQTIAVRGIARHVGTTSIAANLALMFGRQASKTLVLDLSLWNSGLTQAFAGTPEPALIRLAEKFGTGMGLSVDFLETYARSYSPNLDVLPGAEHWLEAPALHGENGWNFIQTLLVRASERWNTVVADLGSNTNIGEPRDTAFHPACAVHASVLYASSTIVGISDSIEYLRHWQDHTNEDAYFRNKTIYVVNQHRPDLPFGLDRYKLDPTMRIQCGFIPALTNGLLGRGGAAFFVERASNSEHTSGPERQALGEFENIVLRVLGKA